VSGVSRFTFDRPELLDGLDFIVLTVALFAVAEVLVNVERNIQLPIFKAPNRLRELLPTWADVLACRFAMFQSSVVGLIIGPLPGAGSTVASFISYAIEKRFSKHPERFGKGAIEGVAAPEGANNSETGGAMIPLLSLGIPGSGTTAIMLGALIIYGIQPGPLLFRDKPEVVWPVIASMYIGNVMLLVLNLPCVPLFASILRIPYRYLYPGVLTLCIVGVWALNESAFDLWLLAFFSLLGYVLRKIDVPAAPIVLAFVLGPLAERALRQSLVMSQGSLEIFVQRPLAAAMIATALVMFAAPLLGRLNRVRTQMLEEEG
jgi:putative tricarboxylic transport membrane protein